MNLKNTAINKRDEVIEERRKDIAVLSKEMESLRVLLEEKTTAYDKLEKKYKQALDDKEKLRQRIMTIKLKNSVNVNQKLCKNCSQEYSEIENFNWSCRTHRVIQLYIE